jgi:hypothetical protein
MPHSGNMFLFETYAHDIELMYPYLYLDTLIHIYVSQWYGETERMDMQA